MYRKLYIHKEESTAGGKQTFDLGRYAGECYYQVKRGSHQLKLVDLMISDIEIVAKLHRIRQHIDTLHSLLQRSKVLSCEFHRASATCQFYLASASSQQTNSARMQSFQFYDVLSKVSCFDMVGEML